MRFSIVVATYNVEMTIRKTLDSVLEQSFDDYEIVIIDGQSTDGTLQILQEYAEHYADRLIYISEKDAGIYDAMNKGIMIAHGEYVYFLGSGDTLFDRNCLERVNRKIEFAMCPEVIYGNVIFGDGAKQIVKRYGSRKAMTLFNILLQRFVCHQAVFSRRDLFGRVMFDTRYRICADQAWFIDVMKLGIKPIGIDDVVCVFDTNGISSSSAYSELAYTEVDMLLKRISVPLSVLVLPLRIIARKLRKE